MSSPYDRRRAPIDRSALAAIVQGDAATEQRLLRTFRKASDADSASLRHAFELRDRDEVVRALHRILGASRMAGATALTEACEAMAQAGTAGDWQGLVAGRRVVERELARVNAYVDSLTNKS